MLSRLISLLRRIPAVGWAIDRLRPPPQGGDLAVVSAIVAPASPVAATPAPDTEMTGIPPQDVTPQNVSTDVSIATIAEQPDTTPPVVPDEPPAVVADVAADEMDRVRAIEVAFVATAPVTADTIDGAPLESPVSNGDDQPVETAEVVADPVQPVDVESVTVAEITTPEAEETAVDVAALVFEAIARADAPEPATIAEAVANVTAAHDDQLPVEAAIESVVAASAPETRARRTPRKTTAQPADRAALIRQRWAETGIRMWNPRSHGAGSATLAIQGRIELLPPADGETMPRYDKLEFRLLGGQIVCEGVIVEAPMPAGARSFSPFAEPRQAERTREPARARQAALA